MSDKTHRALADLTNAFPPHSLDTSNMFDDWGTTYTDVGSFKQEAHGRTWAELTPQFLEFHHDALLFVGPKAVVELIPAYLATVLRNDPELNMLPSFLIGVLTRASDARFDARFAGLDSAQRDAVTHALEAWIESVKDSPRQRSMIEALKSYWQTKGTGS